MKAFQVLNVKPIHRIGDIFWYTLYVAPVTTWNNLVYLKKVDGGCYTWHMEKHVKFFLGLF